MQGPRSKAARSHRLVSRAIALLGVFFVTLVSLPATAQTIERIRDADRIRLGYLPDAPPFTSRTGAGAVEGYAATLCQQIADRLRTALSTPQLVVEWVPVTVDNRVREVQQGRVDLLCAPTGVTLARRQDVAFSIPVFASGNRAVLRADARAALRDALAENSTPRPVWRGQPAAKVLQGTTIAAASGTSSAAWIQSRRTVLQVDAQIVSVPDYRAGLQQLLDGEVDVFFGDRALVLGAMDSAARERLVILDRLFTHEPFALALARGDEDFRLLVDTTLSQIYAAEGFDDLYAQWFGEFDANAQQFFQWNTLPQE